MSVNDLQNQIGQVRQPFASTLLNGSNVLTGLIEASVTNNSHFTADTFRAVFALNELPDGLGAAYWSNSDSDLLEISMGFRASTGSSSPAISFTGAVDDPEVDLVGRTLTLTGRDLSSRFLDNKTSELFAEQTASDIATTLAARRGLKASVTPTTKRAGSYYQLMHSRMTQEQTEWDLLTFLAQQENYDVWVSGTTLNFQPPIPSTADSYVLTWVEEDGKKAANFVGLKMRRSQTLAKDVIVKVRSWNQAQGKTFTAMSKRVQASKSTRAGGDAQLYSFNVPNLTQEQAQQWANSKAADITKHERVITGRIPADTLLTTRSLIKLTGTGTSWDQVYYPDTITRSIAFNSGFTMEFRAKNHSTESTVLV